MTLALRPYQRRDADAALACIARRRHVVYVLPTGGGKSVVIAAVIAQLAAMGLRIVLMAHRDELVTQLSEALTAAGVPHGIIAPGHDLTGHAVHVASVATLDRRREDPTVAAWLRTLDVVVPDEAHHVAAGQWSRIFAAAPSAVRFGATATPFRLDGKGLGDTFDEAVRGPSIRQLMRLGFLTPLRVYAPPVALDGLGTVGRSYGDYRRGDLAEVVNTPEARRAAVDWYCRLMAGQKALAFCVDLQHVADLDADFGRAGWHAESVDGSMSMDERRGVIAGMRGGRTQVLSSCELIGEGFDVPSVAGAIMTRPTMSTNLYSQQAGRAMRVVWPRGFDPARHNGEGMGEALARLGAMQRGPKPHGILLDMVGNVTRHGLPDAERPWTLEGGVAGLERQVAPTARCPRCYLVSEAGRPTCPDCGAAYSDRLTATVSGVPLHLLAPIGGHAATVIATMDFPSLLRLSLTAAEWEKVAEIRQVAKTTKDRREWAARLAERAGRAVA